MLTTRVIPCLLLKGKGLVKSFQFKDYKYVGDPINAVKIFNDKEVDELIFLDITSTLENRKPPFDIISQIASECFMPLCYGGGIHDLDDINKIFALGVEKVSINSYALEDIEFIKQAADLVGSQSIVVAIDVRRNAQGSYDIYSRGGTKKINHRLLDYVKRVEEMGAGEILINSIDRDGTQQGYDIELIRMVSQAVEIPVIACGGAGKVEDFAAAVSQGGASAVAAGSMFVFHGKHRAVLINYPEIKLLKATFGK